MIDAIYALYPVGYTIQATSGPTIFAILYRPPTIYVSLYQYTGPLVGYVACLGSLQTVRTVPCRWIGKCVDRLVREDRAV